MGQKSRIVVEAGGRRKNSELFSSYQMGYHKTKIGIIDFCRTIFSILIRFMMFLSHSFKECIFNDVFEVYFSWMLKFLT